MNMLSESGEMAASSNVSGQVNDGRHFSLANNIY
jgi:hypothetical protein